MTDPTARMLTYEMLYEDKYGFGVPHQERGGEEPDGVGDGEPGGVAGVAGHPEGLPPPYNPMPVARRLIEANHRDAGVLTLRKWRGGFHRWKAGRWVEAEDGDVRSWLYGALEHATYVDDTGKGEKVRPWAPNRYKVADVIGAVEAIIHTEGGISPPTWLTNRADDLPASGLVAVRNGLLEVRTRRLFPHSPRLFNLVSVPFDYDPEAPEPTGWLAFLEKLWPNDEDAIRTLQEWFGYVISGATKLHKILFLLGPLRSGKGTIARVLTALVGQDATAGPTLASLGNNFGLQPLIGKSLAVVADARLAPRGANVVVERLLSISGEDSLTIDRKYREAWTGRIGARFMILTNELPRFGDASGAIASRMVVLSLTRSWLGQENPELTNELLHELPGILGWALDGLDRLQRQGRFTEPESSQDAVVALADLVSPVSAFVRDQCVVGVEHTVATDVLYKSWRQWCEDHGRNRPGSEMTFGKDLRAAVPGVQRRRFREGDDRVPHYSGLRLRQASDQGEQWSGPRDNSGQAVVSRPLSLGEPAQNGTSEAVARFSRDDPGLGAVAQPRARVVPWRHNLSTLWVAQISFHSLATACRPRTLNLR